jgi:GntR family transcriptional regulator
MTGAPTAPPGLARANGTSLHRQLFLVLRDQIARGDYRAGAALPKEETLGEQFQVSRITVRRALADLESQGFVERRHGRGTFVREGVPSAREAPTLNFLESLRKVKMETQVEVLAVATGEAPTEVATMLRLAEGETAVHALRLRRAGGTPLMLTEAWVPARLGRGVTAAALRKHALYEILLRQGLELGRVAQEITAEAADPSRAARLEIEIGAPLLRLGRLLHDVHGTPIQYLTAHLSPSRSRILMDIPGDALDTLSAGYVAHDVPAPAAKP